MSTARRPALPPKATHPMEDIVASTMAAQPDAGETQERPIRPSALPRGDRQAMSPTGGEVQLNVRIDSDVNQAFDRALLTLSAARGRKVTKKAGVEEAIGLLLREYKL